MEVGVVKVTVDWNERSSSLDNTLEQRRYIVLDRIDRETTTIRGEIIGISIVGNTHSAKERNLEGCFVHERIIFDFDVVKGARQSLLALPEREFSL